MTERIHEEVDDFGRPLAPNRETATEYEPLCSKCSDHGFLVVPYGVSGSGSIQCDQCKARNIKRRNEFMNREATTSPELVEKAREYLERRWPQGSRFVGDPVVMAGFTSEQVRELTAERDRFKLQNEKMKSWLSWIADQTVDCYPAIYKVAVELVNEDAALKGGTE